jgi:hypothetical protein
MRKVNDQVCVSKNDVAASGERNRGGLASRLLGRG